MNSETSKNLLRLRELSEILDRKGSTLLDHAAQHNQELQQTTKVQEQVLHQLEEIRTQLLALEGQLLDLEKLVLHLKPL